MNHAKPYPHDYRKPKNADDILKKKLNENLENIPIIGFLDETSPQTTANTQKLRSLGKPGIFKNTTKMKANAFGFYPLNGCC